MTRRRIPPSPAASVDVGALLASAHTTETEEGLSEKTLAERAAGRAINRTRTIEEVREIFDEVRKDIWGAVESRKLQLPIDKAYPFAEIGAAFEHMEANKHLGKIVVTL